MSFILCGAIPYPGKLFSRLMILPDGYDDFTFTVVISLHRSGSVSYLSMRSACFLGDSRYVVLYRRVSSLFNRGEENGGRRNREKWHVKLRKESFMSINACQNDNASCPVRTAIDIQYDASAAGFDWPDIQGVLEKVREELIELENAIEEKNLIHAGEELGDLLFAAFSVARFLNVDPIRCIDETSQRFQKRLEYARKIALDEGKTLESCSAEIMDAYWERAKKLMRQ